MEGLYVFFQYAANSLAVGQTPDPAGIGAPIGLELPRSEVLSRVDAARRSLNKVVERAASRDLRVARRLLEAVLFGSPGTSSDKVMLA